MTKFFWFLCIAFALGAGQQAIEFLRFADEDIRAYHFALFGSLFVPVRLLLTVGQVGSGVAMATACSSLIRRTAKARSRSIVALSVSLASLTVHGAVFVGSLLLNSPSGQYASAAESQLATCAINLIVGAAALIYLVRSKTHKERYAA